MGHCSAFSCSKAVSPYREPLIVIAVGTGFVLVGAVPLIVTFGIAAKNSATIIGAGFVGFGLLLVIPGVLWCIVQRLLAISCCCGHCGACCFCCGTSNGMREIKNQSPSLQNIPKNGYPAGDHLIEIDCTHEIDCSDDEDIKNKDAVFFYR